MDISLMMIKDQPLTYTIIQPTTRIALDPDSADSTKLVVVSLGTPLQGSVAIANSGTGFEYTVSWLAPCDSRALCTMQEHCSQHPVALAAHN